MKITIVTIHYPPEIGGAVHLVNELAKSLNTYGHEVNILTGYPQYNIKSIPKRYQKGLWMKEQMDNLCVTRIRFPSLPRGNKILKGLQHFIYGIWLTALVLFSSRPDIILVGSPPLPLPWLMCLFGKLRGVPVVVTIQDLFPLEAVELGVLSNRFLIQMFEKMERQMNTSATRLTVHSPGNIKYVIKQGGIRDRIDVIYNWVDTQRIKPKIKKNGFAQKYGLSDRFVVSYAGTMGWAQDMMTIVDCAALLKDNLHILFLLVGDGIEKKRAQEKSRRLGLDNIIWLPMQPWNIYPEVLAASDVSMINLHPSLRTPVVPSKLISIMASARPVIASVPAESDARKIIAEADSGICVDAGDSGALAEAICKLASNSQLAEKLGHRGRAYVESNFTQGVCTRKMESVLLQAAGAT
jgi:glycosyltransferase involved in cell wall biosynthesis